MENIMASSTIDNSSTTDQFIWDDLKEAIAKSSGFQRWLQENQTNNSIDEQVRQYLRSTLETLAY